MKNYLRILQVFALTLVLVLTATVVNAATRTANTTGPWSSTVTWSGQPVPTSADDVIINNGITVTVDVAAQCNSITFSFASGTITVNSGITLDVTTSITLQNALASSTGATLAGAGTINCASVVVGGNNTLPTADASTVLTTTVASLSISGGININAEDNVGFENQATFSHSSGTVTIAGVITLDSDTDDNDGIATYSMDLGTDNGILAVTAASPFATVGIGTETFDLDGVTGGNTTTVDYSGSAQTVLNTAYQNLILSGTGIKTLTGVNNINRNLTFSGSASATAAVAIDVEGDLTIETGATFNGSTQTHTIAGDWINNGGTFTGSTGTITLNGAAPSIGGSASTTFNNLIIDGASTTTLAVNTSIAGNLNITAGDVLDLGTFSCNRTAGGGTLTVSAGGTLRLGAASGGPAGSNFPNNFTTNTLTGTVEYNGSNAITQTVYATPTYETLMLTNGTGSGTANKDISANVTVNTTFTVNADVMFTPPAGNTIGGTTNTINGSGTIQVTRIAATPDYVSQYIFVADNLDNMTVDYAGAGAQTINAETYGNIITSGSGTKTAGGIMDVNGDVTIGTGTTLAGSTFAHTVAGDWINNGAYTTSAGAASVTMNGATQSIGGSASTTFNNLIINGAPSTTSLAISTLVAGDLNVTASDILDLNTFACNRNAGGGGTLTVAGTLRLAADAGGQTGSNFPTLFTTNTLTGTVEYDGSNAITQTVYAGVTYETLVLTNGTGSGTANKDITANTTVNTTFTVNANVVFTPPAANTIGGTSNAINGSGTIKVTRILPTASYLGQYLFVTNTLTTMTVDYAGAGAQSINNFTYGSLHTSGSGTKTLITGNSTVNDNVTVGAGTTLNPAALTLNLSSATLDINGTVDFTSTTGSISNTAGTSVLTMGAAGLIRTVDATGVGPAAGASLIQTAGTFTTTSIDNSGTVEYYAGVAQAVTDRNYNNLTISTAGFTKTWTLAAGRTVNGNLTITDGPFTLAGAQNLNLKGDWSKGTGAFVPGPTVIIFSGTALQTIGGTASTTFNNITVNNTSSSGVLLSQQPFITGVMTFTDGIVYSAFPNIITFNDGATAVGASDASFVDGPATKVGNELFRFPIGADGSGYHFSEISAPTDPTHTFSSQYIRASATGLGPVSAPGLVNVSNCEYWFLNRNVGNSTPDVRLSWTASSPCNSNPYITNVAGIQLASFDGTLGSWNTTGGTGSGTVTVGDVLRLAVPDAVWAQSQTRLTLGNTTVGANPLPVHIGNIKAYEKQSGIQIDWKAYNEVNLSNYVVERSANGHTFTAIGSVAAHNTTSETTYGFFDPNPLPGVSFYRLRSVDFDGKSSFSNIVRVNLDRNVKEITIYPNPVRNGYVSFQSSDLEKGNYTVKIFTAGGQEVYTLRFNHTGGAINQTIQLPASVKAGMYMIQLDNDGAKVMARAFIVQ